MNFLYPSFLWAIGLIAVPIIIHFFNFQKVKKVYFTNVTFLREVKALATSRNKIKHWLVLAARCAFIVFLVLAFAQPSLKNTNVSPQQTPFVSLYLDNSLSMQNESNNRSLLDKGTEFSEQIAKVYPKSTRFQLLDNAFEGNLQFFGDQKNFIDKLSQITFSSNRREMTQIYLRQQEAFEKQASKNNHIFWISDFQKNNFKDLQNFKPDSSTQLYLLHLEADQINNTFIDSVWLEKPNVKTNENNTLFAKIRYVGKENSKEKSVKFFVENRQESSAKVLFEQTGSQVVALNFMLSQTGIKPCRLEIEDSPVLFDNQYFFNIKVSPPVKIQIISQDNYNFLEKVYSNENFFEAKKLDINALNYNNFLEADLICLEGTNIDAALAGALQNFLKAGKSLVIFPSEKPEIKAFSDFLGIQLERTESEKVSLELPQMQNPFFEGIFEKLSTDMNLPSSQSVWTWANAGEQLLSYKSKQNFLGLFKAILNDKSKVYVFASPISPNFSDFAKHALFVPIMYKIAINSKQNNDRLAFSLQETNIEILLDSLQKNDIFRLVPFEGGQGNEVIVSQRIAGQKLILDLPKNLLSAGNYHLVNQNGKKYTAIAFNYDQQESVFEHLSSNELQKWAEQFPNVTLFESGQISNFGKFFQENTLQRSLWREMLALALCFLFAEILIIRFWKS